MEALGIIFHDVLYQPLFNALVIFYVLLPFHDLGITIILFTIFIRILLLPLSFRATRSQQQLAALQPRIKALQEQFKNNKERQMRETMALYREHKVNPVGGCLPLLLQLPALFVLYRIFLTGLAPDSFRELYSFVPPPSFVQHTLLGFIDLAKPNIILAALAGLSQFWLSKLMTAQQSMPAAGGEFGKVLSWQTTYFFPLFTVGLGLTFPAGLTTYWIATTLFSLGQQYVIGKITASPSSKTSLAQRP